MSTSYLEYIITISYAPFVGIVFMMIYLFANSRTDKDVKQTFWGLLILEMLELILYDWELFTARWDHPTMLRLNLSVTGYCIRPVMLYLLLLLVLRVPLRSKKSAFCAIPLGINTLIYLTAYFSGIAFSYDGENNFVRGPLGYASHIVLLFYILAVMVVTFFHVSNHSKLELVIVCVSGILCIGSIILESVSNIRSFSKSSIAMAVIFYFMYFQSAEYSQKMEESKSENIALKKISRTDSLTGLLNKRSFMDEVERLIADSPDTPGVIFFFDLDNFKKYNDTLGHLAGDELLKTISDKLKSVFRDNDLIGRFGGDEFYIYMDGIPYETVLLRAQQLLEHLCIASEEDGTDVTASIGIVYCHEKEKFSVGDLVRRADNALYDAKKMGKNRYVIRSI